MEQLNLKTLHKIFDFAYEQKITGKNASIGNEA